MRGRASDKIRLQHIPGVDSKLVWDIIKDDLPGLKGRIIEILNSI